ncbi:MAG: argininosuccinate lyase [Gemmatimonadales bacterium]|nr:argininosuccinate lyase [Gemmatimonadales bacterium]
MKTLWSQATPPDELMLAYTVGDDRHWDGVLLQWDVIGSLGHIEGLLASGLISRADRDKIKATLRKALKAVRAGKLVIGPEHEDAHSAIEAWVTKRVGSAGERIHTGRSRNDQVAVDIRLFLKDRLLHLHSLALGLARALLTFADDHQDALWPGYTHLRRAMPSSAGLWAGALAGSLIDTAGSLDAVWRGVDRSPLGSGAGYGVPLPIQREVAASALGFGGLEHNVAQVQNGRGKLEGAVLFWCVQLGHDLSKLASDVILLSGEEFGVLELPAAFATGSSIMPHKRNPDVFELTRGRAASLEGDLAATLALRGKLTSGYHRDFQLLKEPLVRGLSRTEEMLAMMAQVVPALGVNRSRGLAMLEGGVLATDEVMRRVERGTPFRQAYREVAAAIKAGEALPAPTPKEIVARRKSTGGLGKLDLAVPKKQLAAAAEWNTAERRRFVKAVGALVGRN